jgi:hypothetical protein
MSYSGPFINAIFNIDSNNKTTETPELSVQTGNDRVTIEYNGTGIHTVTSGATPMVVLSHAYNRTEAGILTSITNKINLNGKIYDRGSTSNQVSTLFSAEQNLKNLFKDCPIGNLKIKCGSAELLSVSGVRALSVSTEPSPDNITRSLGYNIDLEYYEKISDQDGLITSCSDSWSIEPMEDYFWEDFSLTANQNTDPSTGRKGVAPNGTINVKNIPQFRMSHRVSARGAIGSGICSGASSTPGSGYFMAYREAQKWVKQRLEIPWSTNNSSGAYIGSYATPAGNLWLFNHVRSTNFSMTEGSYEITDTWIAMPTGITHIEDYTIDISSDEKFVKTVRVQGTIKGLDIAADNKIKGDSSLTPDTTGQIKLPEATTAHKTGGNAWYSTDVANSTTSMQSYRYQNALVAWHSGVKPALYSRASAVTNRSAGYSNHYSRTGSTITANYNRDNPSANPVYHQDRLLNVIPWSTTEGHDTKRGVITYSYEYNNKYTLLSGVISESITVTDNAPVDVVAEVFVLGRKLGPVLQALGAKTSCTKDVSIEITTMPVTGIDAYFMSNSQCPMFTGGTLYQNIQLIVEGLKPFGTRNSTVFGSNTSHNTTGQVYVDRDTQSWNPTEGRYTRNVSWKYQQCNNNRYFLDH